MIKTNFDARAFRITPNIAVVSVEGELDLARVPQVEEILTPLLRRELRAIIVNLERVDFIDSSGIGILVGALTKMKGYGGSLLVVTRNQRFLGTLEILHLSRMFQIFGNLTEALASAKDKTQEVQLS